MKAFDTKAIHGGLQPNNQFGETALPIYQSSAFAYDSAEDIEAVFEGRKFGHIYSRISNPSVSGLEQKLTVLENGLASLALASGMAAISAIVLSLAKSGDQILVSTSLFGGTYNYFREVVEPNNIKITYSKPEDIARRDDLSSYRFIFIEAIGNPKCDVPNISDIAKKAKEHAIPLIVDNTLTTPYLLNAKSLGVNIIVNAATKYIGTGGTTIGGYLTDLGTFDWKNYDHKEISKFSKKCGQFAFIARTKQHIVSNMGACLSPFNAFLLATGLETLSLRMEKHCSNGLKLAQHLDNHSAVNSVNYIGLKSSPYHELAKSQFNDKFGGLLTIRLGSKDRCYRFLKAVKIAKNMTNIGDSRTLLIHASSTLYKELNSDEKEQAGVYDDLIRISVGLEDSQDLIEDFDYALAHCD